MKIDELKKYFRKVNEELGGTTENDSDIIDFSNGESFCIQDIEQEYAAYEDLVEEIDDYVCSEDLDDVSDVEKIKEHFSDKIDENLFMFNQGCLKDFEDYLVEKIKKEKNL